MQYVDFNYKQRGFLIVVEYNPFRFGVVDRGLFRSIAVYRDN